MDNSLKRQDLVYPDLSYKIIGILIKVFKELGDNLQEKHYQRAIAIECEKEGIVFQEQVRIPLKYQSESIGDFFMDFLIDNRLVLEIKKHSNYSKRNFEQINAYLRAANLKLAILANFSKDGVRFKRVVNLS